MADKVVVCTTVPPYVMRDEDYWGAWLYNAEAMLEAYPDTSFFAAIEVDGRGLDPFRPLTSRLEAIGGEYWTFSFDDGAKVIDSRNRLSRVTMGQNITTDYAMRNHYDWVLFMAADCKPPADAIPKLLELNHPLVGGEVDTYCLHGPKVDKYPFPVEEHMATAAFLLIQRRLFSKIRWRCDIDEGMADDPCFHYDALTYHNVPTYVRKDVIGVHYPRCIGPIETRQTEEARTLQW